MSDNSSNNKRLAKNTLVLYVRMLVMMVITLYTSRVVLNALGVEDYGIYNIVAGFVALFSAVSTTLTVAINRFITYEIGTGNKEKLKKVFSTSINIQVFVIIVFIIVAETIGLWYLNNKLVIPLERLQAANLCFQCSLITFSLNLISVPYSSSIVAHERMSAYAYIAIVESVGKLLIAWGITISRFDKLVVYSIYLVVFALIVRSIYAIYCKRHFEECTYHFMFDSDLLKQMFGFVGWAFIGVSSWALKTYGFVILINLFFGPVVNAAYAIANQVQNAVTSFSNNFMMALNPQITKAYASDNRESMFKLIFQGARFSAYIMLIMAVPITVYAPYLLMLWLKQLPEHTVLFVRLVVLMTLLNSITGTLTTAQIATGDIKKYQLVVSPISLLNIPVTYILFRFGFAPETIIIVAIILGQFSLGASLMMLRSMIGISIGKYLREVYLNVIVVIAASFSFPFILNSFMEESFSNLLLIIFISLICTLLAVLFLGCKKGEREMIYLKAMDVVRKKL